MKYSTDPSVRHAVRTEFLKVAIQTDEMELKDLTRQASTDERVKLAIRRAKRRLARNRKELAAA